MRAIDQKIEQRYADLEAKCAASGVPGVVITLSTAYVLHERTLMDVARAAALADLRLLLKETA